MKRTVYNTMIGLMLVCGLAITSTGAMAQGRRPANTTNSNAAATGNRSVATAPRNNAATVTNSNNNVSSRSTTTSVTPQVNRGTTTTTSRNSSTSGRISASTSVRPSVGSTTGSTTTRTTTGSSVSSNRTSGSSITTTRPNTGNTGTSVTGNGGNHGTTGVSTVINSNAGNRSSGGSTVRPSTSGTSNSKDINRPGNSGNSGNNNGSTVRPNTGGNHSGNSGNGRSSGSGSGNGTVRPNNGGNNGHGHSTDPNNRNGNRPKIGGSVMNGSSPKIDYSTFRYNTNARPRFAGDRFFDSYRHNSWSWAKPIRPSVRPWRPSTIWVYRPIVTVNVVSYSSYPTIGGVLGLSWGTSFINALNYLYYNGYYIDGYMDNIVYLTDINLLGYDWDDVMLQFDGNDNFDYVEFVDASQTYDTSRFHSLYNYLCSLYGRPISYSNSMYSWYGGDGVGFVNLGLQYTYDYNYTVLAFGV